MARFYGFSNSEIMAMSLKDFNSYAQSIPIITAREMLPQLTVASFPHMKKESQVKEHRKIYKQAYPSAFENKKPMSLQDLAKVLNGR